MDGCLLIGLPHFPPRKNKLPHSLCQGVQIEKSTRQREGERAKKRSTPLHPSSCFEYAQGRKSIDRSPISTHPFYTLLLYICRRFKVYIDTDIKRPARLVVVRLLRRSREKKRGGGHRKPYGCYSPQADNDIVVLPDQKTTTTQPAKKSGTRPSLIQTDRSRTFRPFLIPQETRK